MSVVCEAAAFGVEECNVLALRMYDYQCCPCEGGVFLYALGLQSAILCERQHAELLTETLDMYCNATDGQK